MSSRSGTSETLDCPSVLVRGRVRGESEDLRPKKVLTRELVELRGQGDLANARSSPAETCLTFIAARRHTVSHSHERTFLGSDIRSRRDATRNLERLVADRRVVQRRLQCGPHEPRLRHPRLDCASRVGLAARGRADVHREQSMASSILLAAWSPFGFATFFDDSR